MLIAKLNFEYIDKLKEKKSKPDGEEKKEFKKVVKEVKIPEQITIQELSNRMAEKSNEIIKFLLNMKVALNPSFQT